MAKKREPPSKHSRAARRATSPSINADKSVKDLPPQRTEIVRPSVLAARESAGVTKKKASNVRGSKARMSAKARKRHERGLQMAEAVLERTSVKIEKSKGRGRSVQDRAKAWDLINKKAAEEEQKQQQEEADAADQDKEWETDEDMDGQAGDGKDASTADAGDESLAGADYIPIDEDQDIS